MGFPHSVTATRCHLSPVVRGRGGRQSRPAWGAYPDAIVLTDKAAIADDPSGIGASAPTSFRDRTPDLWLTALDRPRVEHHGFGAGNKNAGDAREAGEGLEGIGLGDLRRRR